MKRVYLVIMTTLFFVSAVSGEVVSDIREPVDLRGTVNSAGSPEEAVWETTFIPADTLVGTPVGFWVGKLDAAVEVFINGEFIGSHGSFPPHVYYRESKAKYFLIPEELLSFGEENVLALRMFNDSGIFNVNSFELADYRTCERRGNIIEVLNIHIFLVFSNLCLVFGLYFILMFLLRPNVRTNLYYGLANIFLFVYFLEMGLTFELLPFIGFRVTAKSMLPLFFTVLTLFFMEYFKVLDRRALKIGVAVVGVLTSGAFYAFGRTTADIDAVFNIAVLIGALELLYMAWASIAGVIRRNPDAIPVCIGTFIGIGMGMHDILAQLGGRTPLLWLQGIGIQVFILSMFIALALRSVRDQKALEVYSARVETSTKSLERYIERITGVSRAAAAHGQELNRHIDRTVSSVESLVDNSRMITKAADNQFAEVERTRDGVHGLLNSIDVTNEKLKVQSANVEETSATLEEMLANIQVVMEDLGTTRSFSDRLGQKTARGRQAVAESTAAIENIKAVSRRIYEMVEAVNDLAERTSLLSMNAAIEAAKAGSAGSGFAVVAGEIKKLAEGSAEKVSVITEHVDTIMERIEDGIRVNRSTGDVLEEINESTADVVDRVKNAHDSITEQRYSSEKLLKAVQELRQVTEDIGKAAADQAAGSTRIRESLDTLTGSTEQVKSSIVAMTGENTVIGEAMTRISELSEQNARGIGDLEKLLEEKD